MGLDTSHDAWHGAYGAFGKWRHEVAVAAGFIKEDESLFPKGLYDNGLKDSPLDWETLDSMTDCMGNWTKEPDDPLWYLLNHSDCDGVIRHEHCEALADRLEEFIPLLDDPESVSLWRANRTRRFVDGLRAAHEAGEDVDFH